MDLNDPPQYVHNVKPYPAELSLKGIPSCIDRIRDRLEQTQTGLDIFESTCFGKWLDLEDVKGDSLIVHAAFLHQILPIPNSEDEPFQFNIGGYHLKYGEPEFALMTGFNFGKIPEIDNSISEFRSHAFPRIHRERSVYMEDLHALFENEVRFQQLSDEDVVCVCLLLLLLDGFEGRPRDQHIPEQFLTLVDDYNEWDRYPFGSYLWSSTFSQMKTFPDKIDRFLKGKKPKHKYRVTGFLYPFKIWLWETFPYVRNFARHMDDVIPRCLAWDRANRMSWHTICDIIDVQHVPRRPTIVLLPTDEELAAPWYTTYKRYVDDREDDAVESPPKKRIRRDASTSSPDTSLVTPPVTKPQTKEQPLRADSDRLLENERLLFIFCGHVKRLERTIHEQDVVIAELKGRVSELERQNKDH